MGILLIFEKDIGGRITQAVKRCAKANNKYMKDLYNSNEKSLYLPVRGCKQRVWVGNASKFTNTSIFVEEFTPEKIDELVKKEKRRYLLEVDVEYKRAAGKSKWTSIFSRENENWKGGKISTKS